MTHSPKFDIMMTGVIFAFDEDTGDVLHVDEIYEEVPEGHADKMRRTPSEADCDVIRELAAADHPRRKVAVIAMAADDEVDTPSEGRSEFHVDPATRKLRMRPLIEVARFEA